MCRKIATYCLLVSVLLIGNTTGAEEIVNHIMAKDPNRGTGCQPPTANYTFSTRDDWAYSWLAILDRIEGDVIRWEWYDPNSALHLEDTFTMTSTGNGCSWYGIAIRDFSPADKPGDWHVDVYYNDIFQFTENFTIVEGGLCPVRQIYGDNSETTQLLRYVRDNLLKPTPEGREIIKLYYQWSPIIVKAMEGDEDFKQEIKDTVDEVLPLISQ